MDSTKIIAAGLVVLLAAGGVAAAGTGVGSQAATGDTDGVTNLDAQASYDNGTVTVVVTDGGEPLENVSVYVDEERVGTTDANGTVAFDVEADEDLEIELVGNAFEAELEYAIQDGSLRILEEEYEYEYEREDEREEDETEREEEYEEDDDEREEEYEEETESDDDEREEEYEEETESDDDEREEEYEEDDDEREEEYEEETESDDDEREEEYEENDD